MGQDCRVQPREPLTVRRHVDLRRVASALCSRR
ncbi:putative leader peptide [Spirillospora sp. NPDC047279]